MNRHWQTLCGSAWLAWQIESNWLNPWLFAVYALVKPLTASLLLVCLYRAAEVGAAGHVPDGYLPFLYVGSACFMLVGGITLGISAAVAVDREQYGMLKYVRISPARLTYFLIGRGLARGLQAVVGTILALAIGVVILPEVRVALSQHGIAGGWLAFHAVVGAAMLLALGLIVAGGVLNMARYGMFLSEGVAGVLYLLSGVVFPISMLPGWLQPVSLVLPTTYWMEGMRRALLGDSAIPSPLSALSNSELALLLLLSTTVLSGGAWAFFRWCERRAWQRGLYDDVSGY